MVPSFLALGRGPGRFLFCWWLFPNKGMVLSTPLGFSLKKSLLRRASPVCGREFKSGRGWWVFNNVNKSVESSRGRSTATAQCWKILFIVKQASTKKQLIHKNFFFIENNQSYITKTHILNHQNRFSDVYQRVIKHLRRQLRYVLENSWSRGQIWLSSCIPYWSSRSTSCRSSKKS